MTCESRPLWGVRFSLYAVARAARFDQVLLELCGGDVADSARRGGPDSLPQEQRDFMQRQSMVVREVVMGPMVAIS